MLSLFIHLNLEGNISRNALKYGIVQSGTSRVFEDVGNPVVIEYSVEPILPDGRLDYETRISTLVDLNGRIYTLGEIYQKKLEGLRQMVKDTCNDFNSKQYVIRSGSNN